MSHDLLVQMAYLSTRSLWYRNPIQASCIDVSRKQKEQEKSGQCHPGYKGERCEKREYPATSFSIIW